MQRRQFLQHTALAGASMASLVACGGGSSLTNKDPSNNLTEQRDVADMDANTVSELLSSNAFRYGVASGDPREDAVILWTAIEPVNRDVTVVPIMLDYALSSELIEPELFTWDGNPGLQSLGPFLAYAQRDWTVKVDLGNVDVYRDSVFAVGQMQPLPEGAYVYYRFRAGSQVSRTGRAKTTPKAPALNAKFAVASCANLPAGLFSVYAMILQQTDLDFVLHLGDYLYEYGSGEYGDGEQLSRLGQPRIPEPPHEMISRDDYVQRHAQYKRDADLQNLHAAFPMIAVWDDHEITNDAWRDGAENHTEGAEGNYQQRKSFAIRAYFNWMPLREVFPRVGALLVPDSREVIFRRIRFGDLMDLILLDTRIIGRDQQAAVPAIDPSRLDPDRSLLGPRQREWLQLQLLEAKNQGSVWTFLGQQVMFAPLNILELPKLGLGSSDMALLGNLIAVNLDQWDGYRSERDRVREFVKAIGLKNLVVLTGDIHTSWATELYENSSAVLGPLLEQPFGVELVTPSVTSPGFPDGVAELVSVLLPLLNPHIKYNELKSKGYVLVNLSRQEMVAEWRYAQSISDEALIGQENERKRRTFKVLSGTNRLINMDLPQLPTGV